MGEVLYRVERLGSEELGFPVSLKVALKQVRERVPKETESPLRIARVEYGLDPVAPPTLHTGPMKSVWRATVLKFPDIGWAGTYVCKLGSQHRFGNATDWQAPKDAKTTQAIVEYLWEVFNWQRRMGIHFLESGVDGLPVSELIFRDTISTRRIGPWSRRKYTGVFHASHVHTSCYPLIDTSEPCG